MALRHLVFEKVLGQRDGSDFCVFPPGGVAEPDSLNMLIFTQFSMDRDREKAGTPTVDH